MSVKELKDKLTRLKDDRRALIKERDGLLTRQEKLQTNASRSLAGVAVGKLLGQAEGQAQMRVKADGLQVAINEVERRLAEKNAAIDETQLAIDRAGVEEMEQQADEIFAQAREAMDPILDLADELEQLAEAYFAEGTRVYARDGQGAKTRAIGRTTNWRGHANRLRRVARLLEKARRQ